MPPALAASATAPSGYSDSSGVRLKFKINFKFKLKGDSPPQCRASHLSQTPPEHGQWPLSVLR
jgi:hypothetical protein